MNDDIKPYSGWVLGIFWGFVLALGTLLLFALSAGIGAALGYLLNR